MAKRRPNDLRQLRSLSSLSHPCLAFRGARPSRPGHPLLRWRGHFGAAARAAASASDRDGAGQDHAGTGRGRGRGGRHDPGAGARPERPGAAHLGCGGDVDEQRSDGRNRRRHRAGDRAEGGQREPDRHVGPRLELRPRRGAQPGPCGPHGPLHRHARPRVDEQWELGDRRAGRKLVRRDGERAVPRDGDQPERERPERSASRGSRQHGLPHRAGGGRERQALRSHPLLPLGFGHTDAQLRRHDAVHGAGRGIPGVAERDSDARRRVPRLQRGTVRPDGVVRGHGTETAGRNRPTGEPTPRSRTGSASRSTIRPGGSPPST